MRPAGSLCLVGAVSVVFSSALSRRSVSPPQRVEPDPGLRGWAHRAVCPAGQLADRHGAGWLAVLLSG
jgi:hypothetical protein